MATILETGHLASLNLVCVPYARQRNQPTCVSAIPSAAVSGATQAQMTTLRAAPGVVIQSESAPCWDAIDQLSVQVLLDAPVRVFGRVPAVHDVIAVAFYPSDPRRGNLQRFEVPALAA